MPRQPNYYRILDVALRADQAQVQHAYRSLAKRYHPDLVPRERRRWARTQMARINAAYEVLGDPTRRAAYDRQQGYIASGDSGASHSQSKTHNSNQPYRHERRRRERMSRQRLIVWSSVVALGVLLLGALYWRRAPAPSLPQYRWTWAALLSIGLFLVLVILGRVAR
jgi:curved DNA-binding protein CbpA